MKPTPQHEQLARLQETVFGRNPLGSYRRSPFEPYSVELQAAGGLVEDRAADFDRETAAFAEVYQQALGALQAVDSAADVALIGKHQEKAAALTRKAAAQAVLCDRAGDALTGAVGQYARRAALYRKSGELVDTLLADRLPKLDEFSAAYKESVDAVQSAAADLRHAVLAIAAAVDGSRPVIASRVGNLTHQIPGGQVLADARLAADLCRSDVVKAVIDGKYQWSTAYQHLLDPAGKAKGIRPADLVAEAS